MSDETTEAGIYITTHSDLPEAEIDKSLDLKLTKALHKKGCCLHGFRSGGGLRVFRLEQNEKLIGYGEHPHALEALSLLVEDLSFLGRAYKKVYGEKHPHYLTGSSEPQLNKRYGVLDAWVLQGNTFDASIEDGEVEAVLSGYSDYRASQLTMDQATSQPGIPVRHENRGCVFETVFEHDVFPGGTDRSGWITKVVSLPKGMAHHRATMWHSTQTGRGNTVFEAMEKAFAAPFVEVFDHD